MIESRADLYTGCPNPDDDPALRGGGDLSDKSDSIHELANAKVFTSESPLRVQPASVPSSAEPRYRHFVLLHQTPLRKRIAFVTCMMFTPPRRRDPSPN